VQCIIAKYDSFFARFFISSISSRCAAAAAEIIVFRPAIVVVVVIYKTRAPRTTCIIICIRYDDIKLRTSRHQAGTLFAVYIFMHIHITDVCIQDRDFVHICIKYSTYICINREYRVAHSPRDRIIIYFCAFASRPFHISTYYALYKPRAPTTPTFSLNGIDTRYLLRCY